MHSTRQQCEVIVISGIVSLVTACTGTTEAERDRDADLRIIVASDPSLSLVTPDGTVRRDIVLPFYQPFYHACSPSGRSVAYHDISYYTGRADIPVRDPGRLHIINTDGSGNREISAETEFLGPAAWSPDGQRLAVRYATHDGIKQGLGIINADGSGFSKFSSPSEVIHRSSVSWSPDGREILYSVYRSGAQTIWAVNVETGVSRQVTAVEGSNARWSPNGQEIAFIEDVRGVTPGGSATLSFRLAIMDRNGGSIRGLVSFDEYWGGRRGFTWSADGQRIIYDSNGDMYAIASHGGEPQPFAPSDRLDALPHWCGTP